MTRSSKLVGIVALLGLTACGGQSTLSEAPLGDGGVACDPDANDGGLCPDVPLDADGGVGDAGEDDVITVDCCEPATETQEVLCDKLYNDEVPEDVTVVDTCMSGPESCEGLPPNEMFFCEIEQEVQKGDDDQDDDPADEDPTDDEQPDSGLGGLLDGLLGGGDDSGSGQGDPLGDLFGAVLEGFLGGGSGDDGGLNLLDLLLGGGGGESGGFDLGSLLGGGETGGESGGDAGSFIDCEDEENPLTGFFCN